MYVRAHDLANAEVCHEGRLARCGACLARRPVLLDRSGLARRPVLLGRSGPVWRAVLCSLGGSGTHLAVQLGL